MSFKRVRLKSGKFITRKIAESSPLALQGAKPEEIWTTGDGCQVLIRDMETKHLLSVIEMLRVKSKRSMEANQMTGKYLVDVFAKILEKRFPLMVAELERRLKQEQAMTHNEELPERSFDFRD